MFTHRKLIYIVAAIPFVASVGTAEFRSPSNIAKRLTHRIGVSIAIAVFLALPKPLASYNAASWLVTFPVYLCFRTVPSILINVIVTASISARIITTRKRLRRLTSTFSNDNTFFITALLVEAALPSSMILGILIPAMSDPALRVLMVFWVALTVRLTTLNPILLHTIFGWI